MRPKTAFASSFTNYTKGFPGPGTYELTGLESKNGYVADSRFKSYGGPKFSRTGKRFNNSHIRGSFDIPGPGTY